MRVKLFYHSLVSDWNHGNAHFLRGIATELIARGHQVDIFEPAGGWSYSNLIAAFGEEPVHAFHKTFPHLESTKYELDRFDIGAAVKDADLVLVHEWNDSELVRRIGECRNRFPSGLLFFHDTHHRSVSDPEDLARYDLSNYDGVLAYGAMLRRVYLDRRISTRVWTWHEAADTSVFRPISSSSKDGDLVWIGNWGDDERSVELTEFLLEPVRTLGLRARVYGVRYPPAALQALQAAGIEYRGWLPNARVPDVFSRFRLTIHIPRRPYATTLPGIPTIRVFEALACKIPLVCAPWTDCENLFETGKDFLLARNGDEMKQHLQILLNDTERASQMAEHGYHTILTRHTCAHRVDELLNICLAARETERATAERV